ncbi:DUF4136 domain-containing protein [Polaribacter ponticola]|uniref:DUF4136 domain-containing protein n=1 Tax=Polaribacter ponticola TaxID=2978475 RepID=A0ABT5S5R4_9FLAO|nr:DUF4136 domain-containing protein [Polaribacter sp. MSW5]MDD7913430.1 DUF4136 domain-containing protein [Polaribacter sp. MSW5]
MKKISFILFSTILLMSCSSINVASDYDTKVDFTKYKTFAFYKPGIDKADISSLDKKRVLKAIEVELLAQGLRKSNEPDMLVSIFTKSRRKVNINQNRNSFGYAFGWGRSPWMIGMRNNDLNINEYTEGTLFIDFIDKSKKELVWQGIGTGALRVNNVEKKEARIKEFVKEIVSKFPPGNNK